MTSTATQEATKMFTEAQKGVAATFVDGRYFRGYSTSRAHLDSHFGEGMWDTLIEEGKIKRNDPNSSSAYAIPADQPSRWNNPS